MITIALSTEDLTKVRLAPSILWGGGMPGRVLESPGGRILVTRPDIRVRPWNPTPREMEDQVNQSPTNPSPEESSPSSPPRHVPTRGLYDWITHTELASSDPASTKAWCSKVLGWTFKPSFPVPGGEYHLFAYSEQGAGEFVRTTHLKYQVAHHMYMSRTLRMPLRKRCVKGQRRYCRQHG